MTREIDLDLGGTDHGYIYSITFDGAGVQGNVPQLTVTDFVQLLKLHFQIFPKLHHYQCIFQIFQGLLMKLEL